MTTTERAGATRTDPMRTPAGPELIWARPETGTRAAQPLGRTAIVRAAMRIADEEGVQAVTMRRIAADLGSAPMSLYRHIPSKDDLLDLMVDAAYGEVGHPARPSEDWRADVETVARATRALLYRHGWLAPLLGSRPPIGPNALGASEFVFSVLAGTGLDIATVARVINAVQHHVVGSVVYDLAEGEARRRSGLSEQEWQDVVRPYLQRTLATGAYPTVTRFLVEGSERDPEAEFTFGLGCLLDGIDRLVGRPVR